MAWARISDDFLDHPKVAELTVDIEGLAALGLWTSALCWVRADRRRGSLVPAGIAIRYSAGAGKQLAARLVAVGLWEEAEGGYRFHDFEDVYSPGDLSEKRAVAGRAGGKASGKVRAAKATSTKQGASSKQGAIRTSGDPGDDHSTSSNTPSSHGHAPSTTGSNHEANPKQNASKPEAKHVEASRARAGATTHYPEASKEASIPPTAAPAVPADAQDVQQALIDPPPNDDNPNPNEARNRAFGLARWWMDQRAKAGTPVIAGGKNGPLHPLRSLVEAFTPVYTDDEIQQALLDLDQGFPSKSALDRALVRLRRGHPLSVALRPQGTPTPGYQPRKSGQMGKAHAYLAMADELDAKYGGQP